MVRIIVQDNDFGEAANVGGPTHQSFKTFDVELPEVEAYLNEKLTWVHRSVIGIELLQAERKEGE